MGFGINMWCEKHLTGKKAHLDLDAIWLPKKPKKFKMEK